MKGEALKGMRGDSETGGNAKRADCGPGDNSKARMLRVGARAPRRVLEILPTAVAVAQLLRECGLCF